jgi:tetratricopeptide (TPR) repeat protein
VLHRKIAEAVEQLPGREKRAAELAWHYYQGDDPAKALPYALLAGDQAEAVCAHAEAEHHYRMAVSLARELGPSASAGTRLEAVALEKLGQVLDAAARYDEALDVLGQAAELHRTAGRLDRLGRVGTQIGRAHAGQGTPGEGLARVQALVPLLEGQNVLAGLAALYATLAHLHFMERDFAEQLVAAEQALDLARAAHEDRLLAEAEVWRGMALVLLGRRNEGHLALERALSMAEQVGDLEVLRRALNHVTDMYLLAGQLGASLAYGQRAREVAEQLADPPAVAVALSLLGQSLLQLGKWEEAGEHFRQAMDLAGSASASWDSAWPPAGLGALHMFQGNAEEATHLLEEASVMAERTGDLQMLRIAQIYLAERDLLAGCPQAARNRLERLLDLPGEGRVDVDIVLAQALLDLGNEVGAEALARRAAESAGPRRVIRVEALRVLGLALSRQDRGAEADRALCEALSIARSMLFVFGEARVLHACGMHHMHQSRTKDARKHLEEALAVFRQLGARPYAARTERALAQIASPSERGGNGREGPE